MMTTKEAYDYYLDQKINGHIDLSGIRKELKAKDQFSDEDIDLIVSSISQDELSTIGDRPSAIQRIVNSKLYAYLFILFGIVIIGFSIVAIQKNTPTTFGKTLPYIVLCGGIFLIIKHASKIKSLKNEGDN